MSAEGRAVPLLGALRGTLRRLAERSSRERVLRRSLPADLGGGTLFVSPDAALRLWHPRLDSVDPSLFDWVRELVSPGAVVWDVGANVGMFSLPAAHRCGPSGRVLAIEPDSWLSGLLRRSAAARPPSSAEVVVLNAAVADRCCATELAISERGRAGNHLLSVEGSTQTGGAREVQWVVAVTLDWLLDQLGPPTVVKIDTEGAELFCLRGADRLLSEVRPTILCEVSEATSREVGELLASHGYALYDAASPPAERRRLDEPVWNTLAIPEAEAGQKITSP